MSHPLGALHKKPCAGDIIIPFFIDPVAAKAEIQRLEGIRGEIERLMALYSAEAPADLKRDLKCLLDRVRYLQGTLIQGLGTPVP